ncbi:MAG: sigma 54-interacting transcriptional regulator [Polyangia bacterium]
MDKRNMDDPSQTRTFDPSAPLVAGPDEGGRASSYLMVFDGTRAFRFELPASGSITIGRADDADLQLEDETTSRHHARLTVVGDALHLEDLRSRNGTYVNRERISGVFSLSTDDVIRICNVKLFVYKAPRPPVRQPPGGAAQLRQRLGEEILRAIQYEKRLMLLWISIESDGPSMDQQRIESTVLARLGKLDCACWDAPGQLIVLLPNQDASEVQLIAHALLLDLDKLALRSRCGLVSCPQDAIEIEVMLACGRDAAQRSKPGEVLLAADLVSRHRAGAMEILVADPAMAEVYQKVKRYAEGDMAVLVLGETGSGKEPVAAAIHAWSLRSRHRYIEKNCGAIPESLLESELFGYVRGAFSGAAADTKGLFEQANQGTVFLDEVADLKPSAQVALLRVIDQKKVQRVGGTQLYDADVRIVAATNKNLREEVRAGRFRSDLYHRLAVVTITLKPLRERRREIPLLARAFLDGERARQGKPPLQISDAAMVRLIEHDWPGNVRQLKGLMHALATGVQSSEVDVFHLDELLDQQDEGELALPGAVAPPPLHRPSATVGVVSEPQARPPSYEFKPIGQELRELEKQRMTEALHATGGVIARAAKLIGMPERTFFKKMKDYRLT